MRKVFMDSLVQRARIDDRIYLVAADLGYSVLEPFMAEFPDRFLNVGIAEQNAVALSAGLALSGKVVYFYGIIPFVTMRCFEQVRIDLAYMNTNVRLVGVGAGYSYGPAGTTHHAIEDISLMRSLPNMTVCCPGDPVELQALLEQSYDYPGPMYFRLGKGGEPAVHAKDTRITLGKAVQLTEGADLVIIVTSNMLESAKGWVDDLAKKGRNVSLVSMHTVKPLDREMVEKLIAKKIPIVTVEEHNVIGGLGSAVAEVIAESGAGVRFKRIAIGDQYTHAIGSQKYLRECMGLDVEACDDFFD